MPSRAFKSLGTCDDLCLGGKESEPRLSQGGGWGWQRQACVGEKTWWNESMWDRYNSRHLLGFHVGTAPGSPVSDIPQCYQTSHDGLGTSVSCTWSLITHTHPRSSPQVNLPSMVQWSMPLSYSHYPWGAMFIEGLSTPRSGSCSLERVMTTNKSVVLPSLFWNVHWLGYWNPACGNVEFITAGYRLNNKSQ